MKKIATNEFEISEDEGTTGISEEEEEDSLVGDNKDKRNQISRESSSAGLLGDSEPSLHQRFLIWIHSKTEPYLIILYLILFFKISI